MEFNCEEPTCVALMVLVAGEIKRPRSKRARQTVCSGILIGNCEPRTNHWDSDMVIERNVRSHSSAILTALVVVRFRVERFPGMQ